MVIRPVYRQVAEALVTYNSRALALQRVVDLGRKVDGLDHAYVQVQNSHFYLSLQHNTPPRQSRYPDTDCGLGSDPTLGEPATIPLLASQEERNDLVAKCRSELEGLRTAISILTQMLEESEAKEAKNLLQFIKSEGLSSEALKLVIPRFSEKKNQSDAKVYRACGYFVTLKQRSEAAVKAEVTEDVIWADTGIWPSELSLFYHRQDHWMHHQRNCHEAKAMMDHEAEIGSEWTEKIEQIEEMVEREMERENGLRQVMSRNHSNYYLDADEYDSASDDGRGGSGEGSAASDCVSEGGSGVAGENVSVLGSAVDCEGLQDRLLLTAVSLSVPTDVTFAASDSDGVASEEDIDTGVLFGTFRRRTRVSV